MPGSSQRRRLARGAYLAGHLVVAAASLELAARLDDHVAYGAPLWGRYDAELLRAHDADGVVRNVPGARFEKWQIDALGFRGAALPLEEPPGRIRVACVGTSETFGLYERPGGDWPDRLDALLRATHPGADAFNAAVVGLQHPTRQRYVDRYVLPLHPDALVLYLDVLLDATWRPAAQPPGAAGPPPPAPASLRDRLPPSRVLPKLARALKAAVPEPLWSAVRTWRLARAVRRAERDTLGGRPPLDAVPAEAVAAFERHLTELVLAARARGVVPVLVTYPTLGTLENRRRHRLEFLSLREWDPELSDLGLIDAAARLNEAVRRVARALAVPLADVDAALPKTRAYFADYVHYTDAGAERVAAVVLDALERSGVLDRAPTVGAGAPSR